MKVYGEVELFAVLTSALKEMSGKLHATAALPPVKEPPTPILQGSGWTPGPV
jgi:hypothetical protein